MIPTLFFRAKRGENFFLRALLFLAQEGRDTHAGTDCGRRVEQRWPYYFSWRRLADAEDAEDAEEGRKDARQKSNNPNTEGGEKLKTKKVSKKLCLFRSSVRQFIPSKIFELIIRLRQRDQSDPNIVKIRAILTIFWPFEELYIFFDVLMI